MGDFMRKIAYLTIDDSPTKDMREKVDYLFSKDIPAVWFCTGKAMEKYPEEVVYAIKKGFVIGNHSYSHPHFSGISLAECKNEIKLTDEIIEQAYKRSGIARPVKVFRFPYGDKGGLKGDDVTAQYEGIGMERKEALQKFLSTLGYRKGFFPGITYNYYKAYKLDEDIDWYWTYDIMDWELYREEREFGFDSIEKIFDKMEENDPENWKGLNCFLSEDIILTHDQTATTKEFKRIIDRLISKNIEFRLPQFK